jgi:hypothetical protein
MAIFPKANTKVSKFKLNGLLYYYVRSVTSIEEITIT